MGLHATLVSLGRRFAGLDLVGNLGGDLGDVDMMGGDLDLGGDDGPGKGVIGLGLSFDDV